MPSEEAERFQRVEQRRQHGHDVVDDGLGQSPLPLLGVSAASAPSKLEAIGRRHRDIEGDALMMPQ